MNDYPNTVPCIRCGKPLKDWSHGNNQPFDAVEFAAGGHYPSALWDPGDGSELAVNLCDDCLRAGATEGRVLRRTYPERRRRGARPSYAPWRPRRSRLWVLSDLHDDRGLLVDEFCRLRPVDFDVFVCAGDMMSGDIEGSIEAAAALADGKPAVFVAGNHEWMTGTLEETLDLGHAAADRHGVNFLERDTVHIGGMCFAGATLWTPDDPRWPPSTVALKAAQADVIVTHFGPEAPMFSLLGAKLWVYGHHHGFSDLESGTRRLVRNAFGYYGEQIDGEPAIPDYIVEI